MCKSALCTACSDANVAVCTRGAGGTRQYRKLPQGVTLQSRLHQSSRQFSAIHRQNAAAYKRFHLSVIYLIVLSLCLTAILAAETSLVKFACILFSYKFFKLSDSLAQRIGGFFLRECTA